MISSPLKWHGGKFYLADKIISMFPEHLHYVEPYFGGGQVYFRKSFEGVSEVINDLNSSLMNFWEVLRGESADEFLRTASLTPFSEELWANSVRVCESRPQKEGDVQHALAFFVKYRQSRQGLGKSFATLSKSRTRRGMNEQVSSWLGAVDGLSDACERLSRTVICARAALPLIVAEDSPQTLFFLDPPYLHETRVSKSAYEFEMTEGDHQVLLDTLGSIKGKFILCGYQSDLYNYHAVKNGWSVERVEIDNKSSSKATKEIKTECLWTNY